MAFGVLSFPAHAFAELMWEGFRALFLVGKPSWYLSSVLTPQLFTEPSFVWRCLGHGGTSWEAGIGS